MKIDFSKTNNKLIPAIIQDDETKSVLMLGYMNKDSIDKTKKTKKVTFYSRSKKRLWTKGEGLHGTDEHNPAKRKNNK